MRPVFAGHDLLAVSQWPLIDFAWWYYYDCMRAEDERKARRKAERGRPSMESL